MLLIVVAFQVLPSIGAIVPAGVSPSSHREGDAVNVTRRGIFVGAFSVAVCFMLTPATRATDEIQVYNAGIADVGQFTIQQHLNYIPRGIKDPPFPGGLVSNNSINGTPEFA